jgi:hypothetical protein
VVGKLLHNAGENFSGGVIITLSDQFNQIGSGIESSE